MSDQIFHDHEVDLKHKAKWYAGRVAIYGILIFWTFVCLFPIYWTITTSFKLAPNVMQGHMIPFVDFTPKWKGWESLGLSPRLIGQESTVREEFVKRFTNRPSPRSRLRYWLSFSGHLQPMGSAGFAIASVSCATPTSRFSSSAS